MNVKIEIEDRIALSILFPANLTCITYRERNLDLCITMGMKYAEFSIVSAETQCLYFPF